MIPNLQISGFCVSRVLAIRICSLRSSRRNTEYINQPATLRPEPPMSRWSNAKRSVEPWIYGHFQKLWDLLLNQRNQSYINTPSRCRKDDIETKSLATLHYRHDTDRSMRYSTPSFRLSHMGGLHLGNQILSAAHGAASNTPGLRSPWGTKEQAKVRR